MLKPKILIHDQDRVTWHNEHLRQMLSENFDIRDYDHHTTYNAKEYSVVTSVVNPNSWFVPLAQQGAKIIYDALWEYHYIEFYPEKLQHPGLISSCKYFFWINEYFVNINQGYHRYSPNKKISHKALLPVRQTKPHRAKLLSKLQPWLDQIIYSQVDQGRFLPNDQTESQGSFQRYFNPEWYDSTLFSIVSETTTYSKYQLHITEKSFKPIAYYHPFVTWGQTGTLKYLRELGFETFENLFDESYDIESDQDKRLEAVIKNIADFDQCHYDSLTQQKLQHNHDLFYNQGKVNMLVKQGIVNPILEYVQT